MVLCAIFLDDGRRVTGIFETREDPIEALRQQNRVNTAQSALASIYLKVRGELRHHGCIKIIWASSCSNCRELPELAIVVLRPDHG